MHAQPSYHFQPGSRVGYAPWVFVVAPLLRAVACRPSRFISSCRHITSADFLRDMAFRAFYSNRAQLSAQADLREKPRKLLTPTLDIAMTALQTLLPTLIFLLSGCDVEVKIKLGNSGKADSLEKPWQIYATNKETKKREWWLSLSMPI